MADPGLVTCFALPRGLIRRGQPGSWLPSFERPKEANGRKGRPGEAPYRVTLCCLYALRGACAWRRKAGAGVEGRVLLSAEARSDRLARDIPHPLTNVNEESSGARGRPPI